jgi:hypothetical protein
MSYDIEPTLPEPTEVVTEAVKRKSLAMAIQREVASGNRVESQMDANAIMVSGKPVHHVLHLILTVLTGGFWVLVWLPLTFLGGERRIALTVDDYGNVLRQKMPR